MSRGQTVASGGLDWLLKERAAVVPVMLVYLAVGFAFLVTDQRLDDEGLVTYLYANWARQDLLPVFFLQKAKPVLSLLYLPVSYGGIHAVLAGHLILSVFAVPLIAAVGRKLALSRPNLPALILAFSPIYFHGGAAGLNNNDGVFGVTLFLYLLLVRRWDWGAGILLGLLPWVRHELAVFWVVFFVRSLLLDRRWPLVAGALVFPVVYWLGGALYQENIFWLVRYPPATMFPMPGNPVWSPVTAGTLLVSLFAVTPATALAFSGRMRWLSSVERTLFLYTVLWLFLSTVLPVWRIANFGFVPRYSLQVLPMLALLTARAVQSWESDARLSGFDFLLPLVMSAIFVASGFQRAGPLGLVLLGTSAVLALALLKQQRRAVAALVFVVASGPFLGVEAQVPHRHRAAHVRGMAEWIRKDRERDANSNGSGRPIFTNSPLLSAHLKGAGKMRDVEVMFMIGEDQKYDLVHMTNEANGQRSAILDLVSSWAYGRGVLPGTYSPDTLPPNAALVLRNDPRVGLLLPEEVWADRLETIFVGQDFRVLMLKDVAQQSERPGAESVDKVGTSTALDVNSAMLKSTEDGHEQQ